MFRYWNYYKNGELMIQDKKQLEDTLKSLIKWYINVHQLSVTSVNEIDQSFEYTLMWFHNEIATPYIKMRKQRRQGRREAT